MLADLGPSESLTAVMSGAANTTNPHFLTMWREGNNVRQTGQALNGATAVTLVAAPTGTERRQVQRALLFNGDDASVTVTLNKVIDGTSFALGKLTIAAGSHAVFGERGITVIDSSGQIAQANPEAQVDIDAGSSGTAGSVDVFPETAAKGKLAITAADNAGDTTTTLVNASQAAARTYTIPDAGADASFLMSEGEQTITESGDTLGTVPLRFGGTATEGLELTVFEETISPAAVETNVINIPANSQILSVQSNVESALTGGGTTDSYGLGTAGDPDKYGSSAALTQNSKSNFIGDGSALTASEQMVLTGTASETADGDTALTVGSVRVRVVYLTLNALDNA